MRKRENSAAKRWLFKFACDLVFTFVFCIHLGYLALIPRIYGFCSPKFFKLVLLEFLCSLLCVPFGSDFPSQFHGVVNFGLFPGKQSHPLRVSSQLSTGGTDDSGNFAMLYVVTPGRARSLPAPSTFTPPIRVQLLLSHYHHFGRSTGSRSTRTSASHPMPFYAGRPSARHRYPGPT